MDKATIIIVIIILIIVGGGLWFVFNNPANSNNAPAENNQSQIPKTYDIQGMKVEILKEGSGEPIKSGQIASVHYTGTLQNGTKFDSSLDRGEPFSFQIDGNQVIKGWDLGVVGMKVGEKRKLTIPPELAYGSREIGNGLIPANSTLIFEVELLKINPAN
jgi:FKBP-type peptidyl-prolyl cis-trans isomerase